VADGGVRTCLASARREHLRKANARLELSLYDVDDDPSSWVLSKLVSPERRAERPADIDLAHRRQTRKSTSPETLGDENETSERRATR
jgi:hypothetical protein